MIKTIIGVFVEIWDFFRLWIKYMIIDVLSVLGWGVIAVLAVYDGIRWFWQWIAGLIQTAQTAVSGAATVEGYTEEATGNWLNVMAGFVPLQACVNVLSWFAILWGAVLIYRFVKSWIPTVS